MKHLRKSILTLLALTLFGGAGAWAQEEVLLTTVTATGQTSSSQSPDGIVTVSLNGIGYYDGTWGWLHSGSVTVEAAQGYTITRCVFKQGSVHVADDLAPFTATIVGGFEPQVSAETSTGQAVNDNMDGITSIEVYGTAPAQAIELTKTGANQWTLGQTPDYDLELQVEYYQKYALKEIPAGWTVMVNGVPQTQPYQGDSLLITETDSVTLIPDGNPRRVKSVTLEEEGPAVVEPITVTINQSDWGTSGNSFTKDGVTVSAGMINAGHGNLMEGGSFSTTLGNFTSIVVTSRRCEASGTGWSNTDSSTETWSGTPASSVSFSGDFLGMGMVPTTIVCTIVPTN